MVVVGGEGRGRLRRPCGWVEEAPVQTEIKRGHWRVGGGGGAPGNQLILHTLFVCIAISQLYYYTQLCVILHGNQVIIQ